MESIEDIIKRRKSVVKKIEFYTDDEGKKVEKEKATRFIIAEYDKDGNIVNEIHGNCNVKDYDTAKNDKCLNKGDER